jgi:hypothetical protein
MLLMLDIIWLPKNGDVEKYQMNTYLNTYGAAKAQQVFVNIPLRIPFAYIALVNPPMAFYTLYIADIAAQSVAGYFGKKPSLLNGICL